MNTFFNSLNLFKLCFSLALLLIINAGCKNSAETGIDASLPANFAALSDTAKVRVLIDRGITPDSLAAFVCESINGKHGDIRFSEFDDIEIYIGEKLGDEAAGMYGMSFEMNMQQLPLDKRYTIKMSLPLTDITTLGYTLGLEYVNQVIENKMTIGQVDREIAEFRRACASDEDTYEHFLKGFSTGIQVSTDKDISPAIVAKYGGH